MTLKTRFSLIFSLLFSVVLVSPDYPRAPTREESERETMEYLKARIEGRSTELARRNVARLGLDHDEAEKFGGERGSSGRGSARPSTSRCGG